MADAQQVDSWTSNPCSRNQPAIESRTWGSSSINNNERFFIGSSVGSFSDAWLRHRRRDRRQCRWRAAVKSYLRYRLLSVNARQLRVEGGRGSVLVEPIAAFVFEYEPQTIPLSFIRKSGAEGVGDLCLNDCPQHSTLNPQLSNPPISLAVSRNSTQGACVAV